MGRTLQRVAGLALILLAAGLGWLAVAGADSPHARLAVRIAGGAGGVGLVLLVAGTRAAPRPRGRRGDPDAALPRRARPSLVVAGAACLLVAAGGVALGVDAVRARSEVERRWDEGAHARSAVIGGSIAATPLLGVAAIPWYVYRLDVRYVDAAGAAHVAQERIVSVRERLRPEVAQVARHDAADPAMFVTSWSASFTYGPRLSEALTIVLAALLGGAGLVLLRAGRAVRAGTRA